MKTKIEIKNIRLHFGKRQVLKGIDLNIPDKSIVAIIGPSGCGKSSLLRCINRMHDLNSEARVDGDILMDGQSIFDHKIDVVDVRRKIGMVFQKPNPFPKSIFQNVAYGLQINGLKNNAQLPEIVEQTLRQSSLWDEVRDQLGNSALELSGGQQQRLCIARAIAVKPEVLLMDEPCSSLDPISTHKIEELMLQLKEEYCIAIVTHNMQQAQRVSDYTAFMYLGELIEFGETQQIFNAPREKLTREYVTGNFG
jgi:phosphate transport system ATP-binding protein